ncbi:hypothetical protein SEVIR_1G160101v4 [Setaria viridis]
MRQQPIQSISSLPTPIPQVRSITTPPGAVASLPLPSPAARILHRPLHWRVALAQASGLLLPPSSGVKVRLDVEADFFFGKLVLALLDHWMDSRSCCPGDGNRRFLSLRSVVNSLQSVIRGSIAPAGARAPRCTYIFQKLLGFRV